MKKLTSILLATLFLVGINSLTSIANAQGSSDGTETLVGLDDSAAVEITGEFVAARKNDPVYSVEITWQSTTFEYEITGSLSWDPETHQYDNNRRLSWKNLDGITNTSRRRTVTVENHSSEPVTIFASMSQEEVNYGITSYFDTDTSTPGIEDTTPVVLETRAHDPSAQIQGTIAVGIKPPDDGLADLNMPDSCKLATLTLTVTAVDAG